MDSFRKGTEKLPVYIVFSLTAKQKGDIMLLSTLDKNHLSNLANLHHTISELLIGLNN
jgi:hypothetical protein